jgi:hypothetical protein
MVMLMEEQPDSTPNILFQDDSQSSASSGPAAENKNETDHLVKQEISEVGSGLGDDGKFGATIIHFNK